MDFMITIKSANSVQKKQIPNSFLETLFNQLKIEILNEKRNSFLKIFFFFFEAILQQQTEKRIIVNLKAMSLFKQLIFSMKKFKNGVLRIILI